MEQSFTEEETHALAMAALTMSDINIVRFCSEERNTPYCDQTPMISERIESVMHKTNSGHTPHSRTKTNKLLSTYRAEDLVDYAAPLDDEGFEEFFNTSPEAKDVIESDTFLTIRADSLGLNASPSKNHLDLSKVSLTGNLNTDAKTLSRYSLDDLEEYAEDDKWVEKVISSGAFSKAKSHVASGKVPYGGMTAARPVTRLSRSPSPRRVTTIIRSRSPSPSKDTVYRSRSVSPVSRRTQQFATRSNAYPGVSRETDSEERTAYRSRSLSPASRRAQEARFSNVYPRSKSPPKTIATRTWQAPYDEESDEEAEMVYAACTIKRDSNTKRIGKPKTHWRT